MISYLCLNNECFYVESYLSFDDVNFKHVWNSEIDDLDMVAHCPSCGEPMIHENYEPDTEVVDNALQKKLSLS